MPELVIRIPGEPVAQGRPKFRQWRARDGRTGVTAYDPAVSRNWKATAQQHMAGALDYAAGRYENPPAGPLAVRVLAVFTCPKTDHRKTEPRPRRWHTKKPDGDNVLKAVKDAAKGILWLDDSQVAVAEVTKLIGAQGEAPYVEIRVRALGEIVEQGGDATRSSRNGRTASDSVSDDAPGAELPPAPGASSQPELFKEG